MTTKQWLGEIPIHVTATVIVTADNRREAEVKLRNRVDHACDIEDVSLEDTWSGVGRIVGKLT